MWLVLRGSWYVKRNARTTKNGQRVTNNDQRTTNYSLVCGLSLLGAALGALVLSAPLHAQPRFKGGRGAAQEQAAAEGGGKASITPSGLRPVFPAQMRCPQIASPYGSRTRYDGSARPASAFGGYHGGIDISLEEGTPLLALAAGTVVSKGEGGMMEGIFLWLQHSPQDTGLAYWVYSKYQHLMSPPGLEVGAKVEVAQPIGRSGRTGTAGRHYGPSGYPHLHLTTRKSSSDQSAVDWRASAHLFDPVAIYHEAAGKSAGAAGLADREGEVPIPVATADGKTTPPGTRVVWPVACRPR